VAETEAFSGTDDKHTQMLEEHFAGRSSGCWNKRWTKSAWKTQGQMPAAETEHQRRT